MTPNAKSNSYISLSSNVIQSHNRIALFNYSLQELWFASITENRLVH